MENLLISKKTAFLTLGCKVNAYETEAIKQLFRGYGTVEVPFRDYADIYLVNTCTVTNVADRKSRQMLRQARKRNPDAVIVALGCYVQEFGTDHADDGLADLYIGNRRKAETASILNAYLNAKAEGNVPERFYIREDSLLNGYESMNSVSIEDHCRANIKIQDGCNQFCSYCIIPFARGRIASRSEEDIVAEAGNLAASGFHEIVLTGIHLSSYGLDNKTVREQQSLAPLDGSMPLISLIQKLAVIEGIERIRLGSLEPRIITEPFVKALSAIRQVCPHFHLSLQSGCDRTLKAMNRKYTVEEYEEAVRILRKYYENPALTTDIIVGFPGESEEDFRESLAFAEKIGFSKIHIFPYSRRKGTVADRMSGQVRDDVKKNREAEFLKAELMLRRKYSESFLGKTESVLIETVTQTDGILIAEGCSERYIRYRFPVTENLTGSVVRVQAENITTDCIILAKMVDILHKIE